MVGQVAGPECNTPPEPGPKWAACTPGHRWVVRGSADEASTLESCRPFYRGIHLREIATYIVCLRGTSANLITWVGIPG